MLNSLAKTGSKSCSSALRKLGYNVADFMEMAEYLTGPWSRYLEGNGSIDQVIESYKLHGFDVNQDYPGNFAWEELYEALPSDTKVTLSLICLVNCIY